MYEPTAEICVRPVDMIRFALFLTLGVLALPAVAQQAPVIRLAQLKEIMETPSEQIQVINFWATWCAPCVKELPLFEALHERADVKVSLVSLDFEMKRDPNIVYRFVERKKLKSHVYILDEKDPNVWIDAVEKKWQGAIPVTLLVNTRTGQRKFIDHEVKEGDLERWIEELKPTK